MKKTIKILVRNSFLILTLLLIILLFTGSEGIVSYINKKRDIKKIEDEISLLEKKNDEYIEKIKELETNPKLIEVIARTKLGMVKENEIVYKVQ
jgi:cell division protein FtsB